MAVRMSLSTHVKQEDIIWKGRPSQMLKAGFYARCVLMIALIVIAACMFDSLLAVMAVYPLIRAFTAWNGIRKTAYILTSRKLICCSGVFTQEKAEAELSRISDISVYDPWYFRIIGLSDIYLSLESGGSDFVMHGIKNAGRICEIIRTTAEDYKTNT